MNETAQQYLSHKGGTIRRKLIASIRTTDRLFEKGAP